MDRLVILGVDTGNYNTKTEHTTIPSGFEIVKNIPTIQSDAYLSYQGRIYVPSDKNRVEYIQDKTVDDTHFILTLMGIGSELMYLINKSVQENGGDPQLAANRIEEVYLGVGLPPAHHAKLAASYKEYFLRHLGERTEFIYNGITFSFKVPVVRVLAQDYTAVMEFNNRSKYARIENGHFVLDLFYAIDIGGKTVDYVEIRDGKPTSLDSLEDGILTMFKSIEKNLRSDGFRVDDIRCEKILKGDNVSLDQNIKDAVIEQARRWTDMVLRKLDNDINFQTTPVVFIGGGSRLLRKFIQGNPLLNEYEFLGNASANAFAYSKFLRDLYKAGGIS